MIGKLDNLAFLLLMMIFYVNVSSIFSMSIEPKKALSSPSNNDLSNKNDAKYNNNFILINEKLDNFNQFLDNMISLNICNFFEKSLEKELTKSKKIYFEKINLDSSILTQVKSNDTDSNKTDANNKAEEKPIEKPADNKTVSVSDTKEENKENNASDPNVNKNPPSSSPTETVNERKEDSSKTFAISVSSSEEKKELKKDLERSKSDIDKIKYGTDDLKDKTNKILDKMKDLDEKQTNLIIEMRKSLKESYDQSNRNIYSVNEKTEKLERELELQKQNAIDIKILYGQAQTLSKRIDNADSKSREISESLSSLTDDFRNVKFKIISDKIDSDNKMVVINKKLTQQLKIMYTNQILDSQRQAEEIQNKLAEYNLKVKQIKARLPETDNVCSLLTNCGSCTSNPNCGWCSMSQECVPGSKNGPSNGQCTFFDYGSCGGPRDCGSYNNCGDCLKDISCGWCNSPGNQKCMEKNLAEQGNCSQDVFIHLWKSLNICPHNKNLNQEASFNSSGTSVLDALKEKDNTKIPLIDPLMKKRLIEELKFYLKAISENELKLGNILSAVGDLKRELLKLETNPDITDDYAGIAKKVERTEEEINKEFKNITEMLLPILQDYLKKANEKESIVKSGDDLLKEIKVKEKEPNKDQTKATDLGSNFNVTKIESPKSTTEQNKNIGLIINEAVASNNNTNIISNSTVGESGLIKNDRENVPSANVTSTPSLPSNNSSILSNQTLDHIEINPAESNKTKSNSNDILITNQTNIMINSTDNNSTTLKSANVSITNSTISSSNNTSFIEKKSNDHKTNLRAKASIII